MITSSVNQFSTSISYEDLEKVIDEVQKLAKKNDEWVLMSPNGMIYRGSAEEMIRMLAPHHPLMTIRPATVVYGNQDA